MIATRLPAAFKVCKAHQEQRTLGCSKRQKLFGPYLPRTADPDEAKNLSGGKVLRLIQIRLNNVRFALSVYKTLVVRFCDRVCRLTVHGWVKLRDSGFADSSSIKAANFFIRTRNETFFVTAEARLQSRSFARWNPR